MESSRLRDVAVEIRPGVFRPDWSAVTTDAAREALSGRMAARAGLLDKWSHALEADEDQVWRAVLRLYAEAGRPPRLGEIAAETGVPPERVSALLAALQLRDLLGLEPGAESIRYAYPFTQARTGHRIELNGRALQALCAVDALGVGAMYRTDVLVESACRLCGEPIHVVTGREGRALRRASPTGAAVWYDFAYDESAAASCCPSIAFFCSGEHLANSVWAKKRDGISLDFDEALEVGRALFGPILLDPATAGA